MFKADLILERFSKENRLVERRVQPSRSFVQGFLGMLYVAHANLSKSYPYAQKDILGNGRGIDVEERGVPLLVAAPPGWVNYMSLTDYDEATNIAAELVGIQVGQGTTPPTPTDYALESRIPHREHIPETSDSRGEYYLRQITPGEYEFYGDRWYATKFTCMWPHQLRRVRLRFYREGSPGTVTISIRDSLTGADLTTQTFDGNALTADTAGEWRDIDFPTYPDLGFVKAYYIVMRATAGDYTNSVHVICDADETYGGGVNYYSSNGGANWSSHSGFGYGYLCLFEEFGRNLTRGILYGGCEVYGLSFSHPNGQFTIRRFFYNLSGDSWTINEVGVYAMGTHSASQCWSFLVARDIVSPGIAVANNELLGVTYVPQITV